MRPHRLLLGFGLLLATGAALAADNGTSDVRARIAASVAARLGDEARIDVEVLQSSAGTTAVVDAAPLPGVRVGVPARFVLTLADGRRATAVARISAEATHPVAARNLSRDAELSAADVSWVSGGLDGQLLEPLPALDRIVGGRVKRAVARGEIVSAALLTAADAVRGNDPVTLVIRRGPIEVRGAGRAISSGSIGDTIRVLRPGSREPLRARIVAPGTVEILQ